MRITILPIENIVLQRWPFVIKKYYRSPEFVDFSILFLGTLYINYHYNVFPPDFYSEWVPISFFKVLSTPLSSGVLVGTRILWTICACLAGLGFGRRLLGLLACLFACINLGHNYNFGNVYHSYSLYMGALILLGIGPWFGKTRDQLEEWIKFSLKVYVVYVMTLTGVQKLYYGGGLSWALSDAFYIRIGINPYSSPFAKLVLDGPLLLSQVLAAYALFVIELSSPLVFLNKRLGLFYFLMWSSFHVGVTLLFGNHWLFYSQIFVYSVFLENQKIENAYFQVRAKIEELYYRLGLFKN